MGESVMLRSVKKMGHKSIADYFIARPGVMFQQMADEVGVSLSTVSKEHKKFLNESKGSVQ